MDTRRFINMVSDNKFKLTFTDNKINIINYTKLGIFDDSKIVIYNNDKIVIISGKKLVISKLIKDEILVEGLISNIQL